MTESFIGVVTIANGWLDHAAVWDSPWAFIPPMLAPSDRMPDCLLSRCIAQIAQGSVVIIIDPDVRTVDRIADVRCCHIVMTDGKTGYIEHTYVRRLPHDVLTR